VTDVKMASDADIAAIRRVDMSMDCKMLIARVEAADRVIESRVDMSCEMSGTWPHYTLDDEELDAYQRAREGK